jgi:glycosyltransferase involved in cell wall biosynthesis
MDLTVLIATYNRAAILGEAIESVLAQRLPPGVRWELIVVDNNSHDDTKAVVEHYIRTSAMPVSYLFEGRQGKSHALNAGLKRAEGDVIAFTDDDVLVSPEWVATALRVMDRSGADGAGGRILPKWVTPPPAWLANNARLRSYLALVEDVTPQVLSYPLSGPGCIWGANMVFRRSVFNEIGEFDVELGPSGRVPVNSEDLDMVERALRRGLKIVYDPELVVHHRVGGERMRKNYFRRWAFTAGLAVAVRALPPRGHHVALGRPFWLYRRAARAFSQWCVAALLRRPHTLLMGVDFFHAAGILWWYPEAARRVQRREGSEGGPRAS